MHAFESLMPQRGSLRFKTWTRRYLSAGAEFIAAGVDTALLAKAASARVVSFDKEI